MLLRSCFCNCNKNTNKHNKHHNQTIYCGFGWELNLLQTLLVKLEITVVFSIRKGEVEKEEKKRKTEGKEGGKKGDRKGLGMLSKNEDLTKDSSYLVFTFNFIFTTHVLLLYSPHLSGNFFVVLGMEMARICMSIFVKM